ncbi:MAG: cyclic nucleotide-binding domain-containing protein [Bacteroidota bacterium]
MSLPPTDAPAWTGLLPPEASGGLPVQAALAFLVPSGASPEAGTVGGTCLFLGTTRRWTGDEETPSLRYEAYAEMAAGEVLGEMSLLTGEPRSADVRALDEVEVIEVRRGEMKAILAENEALAEALAEEAALRLDQRADVLARAEADAASPMMQASLLQRIRRFFEL